MMRSKTARTLCCVALALATACGTACKGREGMIKTDGYKLPEPITREYAEAEGHTDRGAMLYTSEIEKANKLITHNVKDYGASGTGKRDDGASIEAALAAASEAGGGIVFMPAGKYLVGRQLVIPSNVMLTGEWIKGGEEGFENGTTILVDVGRGDASTNTSAAFIRLNAASKLSGLNIYYPDQSAASPAAYPYTIANNAYLGVMIERVSLINPYRGIKIVNHNVITVDRVEMSPIKEGMYVDLVYDIPRYTRVKISPDLWKNYAEATGSEDSPSQIEEVLSEAVGMRFGKQDWAYLYDVEMNGLDTGIRLETSENGTGAFNGQLYNIRMENVGYGFRFKEVATVGVSVAYADIKAERSAVIADEEFRYPAQVFFNSSSFGAKGTAITNGGDGALCFTNCEFKEWGNYAIDNSDMGYIIADTCKFDGNGKIAHIGRDVASSAMVDCTFASEPVWDNESSSEDVYLKNTTISERIPKLSTARKFEEERRTAGTEMVFYASDYGVVADASYLNFNSATDNTQALQRALNAAGRAGGGTVFLEAGDYYVKDYIVIPEGVELRGNSDTNRHFGVNTKGTTLVTGHGMGSVDGNAFVSMASGAGLKGLNIFYLNQHYSYNIEYPPAVFVSGDGCYIYDVTIPNAYTAVLVNGKNVHIDYLRGLGVSACLVLSNADGAFVENTMITGGDWQDGEGSRLLNAPPADLWTNHPNYVNEGIYIENSSDVTLFECFVFGMGSGLHLLGKTDGLVSVGLGVDASDNAVLLENSGKAVLVNTQLVGNSNYIHTADQYGGTTDFYLTAGWFGAMDVRNTFDGKGTVRIQQYKIANGGVDVGTAKVYMQNIVFDLVTFTMCSVQPKSEGYLLNSVGTINILRTEGESPKFGMINIGKR